MTTDINDDMSSVQSVDRQQQQSQQPAEWNGQEPMRRRRRKRKRKPQQQQLQQDDTTPGVEMESERPIKYWRGQVADDSEALHERDGIILTINSAQPTANAQPPKRQGNHGANEFVQGMVMRVQDDSNEAQQSQQVEDIRVPVERRAKPPADGDSDSKSYRKPYSVAKKEEQLNQSSENGHSAATELKNILKKSGGLSLSEILQQQNLSLDDLLKGKQTALYALQNTPTPPEPPGFENPIATKATRRIPGIKVQSAQEVRHQMDEKPSRRIPNFPKSKPEQIGQQEKSELHSSVATEATANELSIVGTIASYMIPPSELPPNDAVPKDSEQKIAQQIKSIEAKPTSNLAEIFTIANNIREHSSTLRRLPTSTAERTKPIKEIVSAIRPDLHNSNTRKRIVPIKGRQAVNTTSTTTKTPPKSERLPPRWGTSYRSKTTQQPDLNQTDTIIKEELQSPEPLPTTSTERTTDPIKDIVKNRLALRPRLKTITLTKTTTTTNEAPSSTTETYLIISSETEQPEEEEYTTILPIEEIDFLHSNSSQEMVKEIIAKSQPDINTIEQLPAFEESVIRAEAEAEIESIEQLFEDAFSNTNEEDEPAVTIINDILEHDDQTENTIYKSNSPVKIDVTERNPSLFTDITSARSIDDRTDILELLEDRRSGARLQKVLAQRNMTLNELIEHRQRGSSQLHLAEIFNNKTQPTEATINEIAAPVSSEKLDIVTAFDNFPTFNLGNVKSVKPDEIKTDSEGSSYFTSIINIKPTDEVFKEGRALKPMVKPLDPATEKSYKSTDFYKPWSYGSQENNLIDMETSSSSTQKAVILSSRLSPVSTIDSDDTDDADDDIDEENVYRGVEQIVGNEVAQTHDIIDLELSGHGYKRNSAVTVESAHNIPVGVRSAIIASSSIVGISLLIFIVIFVTCRWRQRRKKTFNYSENFQAVRSRLPILTRETNASKRSTSPPVVFPGGSRSSKINTMDPNSPEVQEYLYDAMRKPFQ